MYKQCCILMDHISYFMEVLHTKDTEEKCPTLMCDAFLWLYLLILWESVDEGEKVEMGELGTLRVQWKHHIQHEEHYDLSRAKSQQLEQIVV